MPASDNLSVEQRNRVEERLRSLTIKLNGLNRHHPEPCRACREEPCGIQFEIWDVEREIQNWKQQPRKQIDNEDTAQREEDEYFAYLITSYGDIFSRFVEVVERKITFDDYGDEVLLHIPNEIKVCINKLKDREGKKFAWRLGSRLSSYLSNLFAQQHAQNKEKKLGC